MNATYFEWYEFDGDIVLRLNVAGNMNESDES